MTDDLEERLRASRAQWEDSKAIPTDLEVEAADYIAELERKIRRWSIKAAKQSAVLKEAGIIVIETSSILAVNLTVDILALLPNRIKDFQQPILDIQLLLRHL